MSDDDDYKPPPLPCFQCLRRVAFDGYPVESMCLLVETDSEENCRQCPRYQRCESTPLVFSTLVRKLDKAKHDEAALGSWRRDFAKRFNSWHDEVVRGGTGCMHNLNTLFQCLQNNLDRDEFERLADDAWFRDAAADAMSVVEKGFYYRFQSQCDAFLTRSEKLNWGLL